MRLKAGCGDAGCGPGQGGGDARRQRERRMRGENGGKAGPLYAVLIGPERNRAVIGIGANEAGRHGRHGRPRALHSADIGAQPGRPGGEGLVAQVADDCLELIERERADVHLPNDGQCGCQHRAAERIGPAPVVRLADQIEQRHDKGLDLRLGEGRDGLIGHALLCGAALPNGKSPVAPRRPYSASISVSPLIRKVASCAKNVCPSRLTLSAPDFATRTGRLLRAIPPTVRVRTTACAL